ncbi:ribonuclease Z [Yeosuana marina]|uniref:ribonuclease Z n=1 Tax=Yeosuana marina TaxID=1565536 RepID=UPI0014226F41|nr:ribonuclease Z [Yeosuana marina]|tara:strand:- start:2101 stop:2433 length:333 start_codon:yes stop_codon:yes gene_type:complete
MILDQDGNISIITQEKATIIELVKKIQDVYSKLKHDNIIVNLTSLNKLTLQDIIEFLEISNSHRASKQSFVIVSNSIDINDTPDEIIVVPTLQEAYDIIEMEEMERDLGI